MSESRLRQCSPSHKREARASQAEQAFTGTQPGGSLWEGFRQAGPPTVRPLRAGLSVQGTPGAVWTRPPWAGKLPGARREGLPTPAFLHQLPLHSHVQSNLASESPLLPPQARPPRWPCRTAAGSETALPRSFFLKTQPVSEAAA